MNFKKFTSLINTYKEKTIEQIYQQGLSDGDWVVTEKIDGACFSIFYDGEEFKYSSRNQFVDDTFFSCGAAVDKYKPQIEVIHKNLQLEKGDTLIIRGELFGKGIQNRVYYGEERYFRVFEVAVEGIPLPVTEALFLLHYTAGWVDGDGALTETALQWVPVLGICSLEEALAYNVDFKSLLTPISHEGDNWSEGVTITPDSPKWFSSGSRVFLKNKSHLFSEKKQKVKVEIILDDFDAERLEKALEYVTESRVYSAVSKLGDIDQTMFGELLKEVIQDLHRDFEEDQGHTVTEGTTERKKIKSELQRSCANAVREVFKTLV